jgi:hypothetical protein
MQRQPTENSGLKGGLTRGNNNLVKWVLNHLTAITDDVVNAARRMLVIGTAN